MSQDIVVLYAEDDEDIRNITEFALDDEGFSLCACESGEQAVQKGRDTQADLLLLDVMMPGMDGPTTLKHLRQYPHLLNTPVIFMTAKVQETEVQSYLDLGAVGVIGKPFDPITLPKQIKDILANAKL